MYSSTSISWPCSVINAPLSVMFIMYKNSLKVFPADSFALISLHSVPLCSLRLGLGECDAHEREQAAGIPRFSTPSGWLKSHF